MGTATICTERAASAARSDSPPNATRYIPGVSETAMMTGFVCGCVSVTETPVTQMAKMHKALKCLVIVSLVTACASCSENNLLRSASKSAEAKAAAEARWARAERDRANALMACTYVNGDIYPSACKKYGAASTQ
jgi:hypothetical protein